VRKEKENSSKRNRAKRKSTWLEASKAALKKKAPKEDNKDSKKKGNVSDKPSR